MLLLNVCYLMGMFLTMTAGPFVLFTKNIVMNQSWIKWPMMYDVNNVFTCMKHNTAVSLVPFIWWSYLCQRNYFFETHSFICLFWRNLPKRLGNYFQLLRLCYIENHKISKKKIRMKLMRHHKTRILNESPCI